MLFILIAPYGNIRKTTTIIFGFNVDMPSLYHLTNIRFLKNNQALENKNLYKCEDP